MLGVTACGGGGGGGGNGPGSKQLNLVIGDSLPLSGTSKALGDSGAKASELAVDQVKRAVEEADADHTVRVIKEDQGSDADTAADSAKKLVNDEGASCLTGPWTSDAVEKTAHDIAIPSKVLEISPVAASADVADLSDHDLIDSTALPVSLEGDALSKAIERDLGGAQGFTVNVAASNDTYGDTVTQDFIEAWQGNDGTVGGQVVLAPPPLSSSSSAYSAEASQLTSGSPDAVLVIDDLSGFTLLGPALASSDGWDPATGLGQRPARLTGPAGRGRVGGGRRDARSFPGGSRGRSPDLGVRAVLQVDGTARRQPSPLAAQEFDATVLCYLAAVAAGSTDGQEMADKLIDITAPGGEQFSWQQLPDAIKALEDGKDIDYAGASGPIDMDVQGNPTSGVFDVHRYTSGGLEVVGEVSVSKPNPAAP